jgi:hypothetical protein
MALSCNVGGLDKAIRIGSGIILVGVGVYLESVVGATGWSVVAFIASLIAVVTAFVGYCPINSLIGLNTCEERARA